MTMAAAEENEGYSDHDEVEISRDSSFYESTQNRTERKKRSSSCVIVWESIYPWKQ
jgi:hypothetical protein